MKLFLPLILFVAISSAFAADPFHGTWKKNKHLSGGQNWVDREAVFKFEVTEDRVVIRTLYNDENRADITIEYALDGAPTRLTDGRFAGDDVSLKRIHSDVWEYRCDTHGKPQTGRSNPLAYTDEGHYTVSHDGTVLIMTLLRTYEDGSTRYSYRFLEKQ